MVKIIHFKILLLADPFTDMKACNEAERSVESKAAQEAVLPNSFGSLSKYNTRTNES